MSALNPTPRVNCAYGAPMGRSGGAGDPDHCGRFYLRRVPLDSGGYDNGGAYWGLGAPLYWAFREDDGAEMFFRAKSRDAAKAYVREDYPHAKFFN